MTAQANEAEGLCCGARLSNASALGLCNATQHSSMTRIDACSKCVVKRHPQKGIRTVIVRVTSMTYVVMAYVAMAAL